MTMTRIGVFLLFACVRAHADWFRVEGLELGEMALPFQNPKVEIIWKLQTNRVPATMKIYKVVPAQFSFRFITNLIAMGGFNEPEKVKNALVPALRGKEAIWEEVPAHKTIALSPQRGKAEFFNTSRIPLPGQPEHGLPSVEQALKLALETAKTLGMKTNELARELDSNRLLVRKDKTERGGLLDGKYTKRDIALGIYLYRAFDGIPVYGNGNCGGLYVRFGNDAQVAEVDLSWRNLEVKNVRPTADRNQLTKWIRQGKAFTPDAELDSAKVKKLTIHDMVAHYRGFPTDYHQSEILPMVVIQAIADLGGTTNHVMLLCPIVEE